MNVTLFVLDQHFMYDTFLFKRDDSCSLRKWEVLYGTVANVLNCDIMVGLNSLHFILFTFLNFYFLESYKLSYHLSVMG